MEAEAIDYGDWEEDGEIEGACPTDLGRTEHTAWRGWHAGGRRPAEAGKVGTGGAGRAEPTVWCAAASRVTGAPEDARAALAASARGRRGSPHSRRRAPGATRRADTPDSPDMRRGRGVGEMKCTARRTAWPAQSRAAAGAVTDSGWTTAG